MRRSLQISQKLQSFRLASFRQCSLSQYIMMSNRAMKTTRNEVTMRRFYSSAVCPRCGCSTSLSDMAPREEEVDQKIPLGDDDDDPLWLIDHVASNHCTDFHEILPFYNIAEMLFQATRRRRRRRSGKKSQEEQQQFKNDAHPQEQLFLPLPYDYLVFVYHYLQYETSDLQDWLLNGKIDDETVEKRKHLQFSRRNKKQVTQKRSTSSHQEVLPANSNKLVVFFVHKQQLTQVLEYWREILFQQQHDDLFNQQQNPENGNNLLLEIEKEKVQKEEKQDEKESCLSSSLPLQPPSTSTSPGMGSTTRCIVLPPPGQGNVEKMSFALVDMLARISTMQTLDHNHPDSSRASLLVSEEYGKEENSGEKDKRGGASSSTTVKIHVLTPDPVLQFHLKAFHPSDVVIHANFPKAIEYE